MPEVGRDGARVREEVRANRFTLVDALGNVRGVFGPAPDGAIGLRLCDADERPQVEIGLDANGATNLKLHGPAGEVCAWLAVGRHGDPSLYLHGASRHRDGVRGHAELSVDEHGAPVLTLHDASGQARVLLALDEQTGRATLSCADAHGSSCALFGEDERGGHLQLFTSDEGVHEVPALPLAPQPVVRRPVPAPERDARVTALGERVARLERARAWGPLAVLALVLAGAALGAAAGEIARPFREPPPPEPIAAPRLGSVVHAGEVVLEDRNGVVRARLGLLPDGTPLLWMSDATGTSTAALSAAPDSGALLRLTGGASSIALSVPPKDPPSLGAYAGSEVLFQAPSHVARFLPFDLAP